MLFRQRSHLQQNQKKIHLSRQIDSAEIDRRKFANQYFEKLFLCLRDHISKSDNIH